MQNPICTIHNENSIFFHNDTQKYMCRICVSLSFENLILAETKQTMDEQKKYVFKNEVQKQIEKLLKTKEECNQLKEQISKFILQLNTILEENIEVFLRLIGNQIFKLDSHDIMNQSDNQWDNISIMFKKDLNSRIDQIRKTIVENKEKFKQIIEQTFTKLLIEEVKLNEEVCKKVKLENKNDNNNDKQKLFQYELMNMQYISDSIIVQCLEFNIDDSKLFIGEENDIKVYGFQNGNVSKIENCFQGHKYPVTCIKYLKNSNSLISGSFDGTLTLWKLNNQFNLMKKWDFGEHNGKIRCLALNQEENLLFSGGDDKYIRIWKYENNKWISFQASDTQGNVESISLSKSQTKCLATGEQNCIIVLEQTQNGQWQTSQLLEANMDGSLVLFITDFKFIFQPNKGNQMLVYNYDLQQNRFIQDESIIINNDYHQGCFTPQAFSDEEILLVQHGQNINIFSIIQGNILKQQEIECYSPINSYRMNHDRQYLVIFRKGSFQIMRKTNYA